MKIIFNGDDFGISPGVNQAMIDCYHNGLLRSTSLMVNMPYAKDAARLAKENPGLSVGIHLTLTAGSPLTSVPTLCIEDGVFNKNLLYQSGLANRQEIRQELQAQMDRYIELMGKLPDHINSHHGIERIEGGLDVLKELAWKYDLPLRTGILTPHKRLENVPFVSPYLCFYASRDTMSEEDVLAFLEANRDEKIVEILAHPGYPDEALKKVSSLLEGRRRDVDLFCSRKLKDYIEAHGDELADYTQIERM